MSKFVYPGITAFINQVAKEGDYDDDLELIGRARITDALDRINSALSQACDAPVEHRQAIFAYALDVREELHLALKTADAAIGCVREQLAPKAGPSETGGGTSSAEPKSSEVPVEELDASDATPVSETSSPETVETQGQTPSGEWSAPTVTKPKRSK